MYYMTMIRWRLFGLNAMEALRLKHLSLNAHRYQRDAVTSEEWAEAEA